MNETELLARLRAEIPVEDASPKAERLVLAGIEGRDSSERAVRPAPAWRRAVHGPDLAWRVALTGGLSAAVTAAVVAAVLVTVPHPGGRSTITIRELAYRAAAAAEHQPPVRAGQWVYWKETRSRAPSGIFQVWTTADATKAAFVAHSKVYRFGFTGRGHRQYIGQPEGSPLPGRGTTSSGQTGTIPITYAGLGSLPRSPQALLRYLANLPLYHRSGWGPAPVRQFVIIEELITTYVMPPRLTGELYRALGQIPGVSVDPHAMDVAGRPGIGFLHSVQPAAGAAEIILDPHTYRLIGTATWGRPSLGAAPRVLNGVAYLRVALVPGPGVMP
jgi:hypothetical protein